jgi:hypothetical protein
MVLYRRPGRAVLRAGIAALVLGLALIMVPDGLAAHASTHRRSCAKHSHSAKHSKQRCKRRKGKTTSGHSQAAGSEGRPQSSPHPTPLPGGTVSSETEGPPPDRDAVSAPCSKTAQPNIPTGDGWVTGAVDISGGPAPGAFYCTPSPVEVAVIATNGQVVARQSVGEHEKWAIPLAPGTYSLRAYSVTYSGSQVECPSEPTTFTIAAGEPVEDSVECDTP